MGLKLSPEVFLHDNCEWICFILFFAFLVKKEMRSGTQFTQQNVVLPVGDNGCHCNVLFWGGGKKMDIFFIPKSLRCLLGGGAVVTGSR